jgi:hypothetical protein
VQQRTRRLWEKQDHHHGHRHRLFLAVAAAVDVERVLYPGCYVDLAPSFVRPLVTYVDIDRRAGQFFGDEVGVQELLGEHGVNPNSHSVQILMADYTDTFELDEGEFDLLVSLYAVLTRKPARTLCGSVARCWRTRATARPRWHRSTRGADLAPP